MRTDQISLVQQSWQLVKPVAKQAGLNFYEKLFEAAPGVRHLFKENYEEQADKLMVMLGYVVSKLENPDAILSDIQKLGKSHQKYGAQPEHYAVVGQCLIATLQEGLADKWTDELQDAWIAAFTLVKDAMITAQESVTEPSTMN
jgi:hemoglobin-like flavoprotein